MADEKDIEGEEGEGGGGKKKLIIIIAVVVLLLGGGAAFFLMGGEDEPVEGAEGAKTEEVAEEEPEEDAVDPFYHSLGDLFVVNLPAGKFKRMQLALSVMTAHQSVVDMLTKHDPRIRHQLFDLLGRQEQGDLLTRAGRTGLADKLKNALNETLKSKGLKQEIEGVYFEKFVLQ